MFHDDWCPIWGGLGYCSCRGSVIEVEDDHPLYVPTAAILNEMLRRAKEDAWAEGWNGARIHQAPRSDNPYRKDSK